MCEDFTEVYPNFGEEAYLYGIRAACFTVVVLIFMLIGFIRDLWDQPEPLQDAPALSPFYVRLLETLFSEESHDKKVGCQDCRNESVAKKDASTNTGLFIYAEAGFNESEQHVAWKNSSTDVVIPGLWDSVSQQGEPNYMEGTYTDVFDGLMHTDLVIPDVEAAWSSTSDELETTGSGISSFGNGGWRGSARFGRYGWSAQSHSYSSSSLAARGILMQHQHQIMFCMSLHFLRFKSQNSVKFKVKIQ